MRILIIQTTRMGDVLQTSPLVRMVRLQHPEAHITMMVRRMGKTIAERHPDVNEVLIYDEDDLYLDMRSKDSDRLLKAFRSAEAFIDQIKQKQFDLVYNLTHSISSAMLTTLAEIPKVVGAHLSDDWQFVIRGAWTNYFFTSVFSREYNDLNLCDITRNFACDAPPCRSLVFDLRDEDRLFAESLLHEHGVTADDFVVCMQLGASEINKRWPAHNFAALARLLHGRRATKIFLLGVPEEAPLGEEFEAHAPGLAVPLYGKTSIPQLAALLKRAHVLVTNDTGTMHIAAAVGCPITLVSVGHVHYRETGPYGEGHCAVEFRRRSLGGSAYVPDGLEERERVRPEQVLQAIAVTLNAGVGQIDETAELADVDLFVSRFSPDGCLQFYPVLRRLLTERDLLRIAYRAMWMETLPTEKNPHAETQSLQKMLACYERPPALAEWQKTLGGSFAQLADMAQQGARMTEDLLDKLRRQRNISVARQLVADLARLDEEMRLFSELNACCKPLILMAKYERDNLEGMDPEALSEATLEIYRACYKRATTVKRKLRRIVEVWDSRSG